MTANAPAEAAKPGDASTNPFMTVSSLPFQAPAFDKIKDSDYLPAFEEGMRQQLAEIKQITDNTQPATFDNTLLPEAARNNLQVILVSVDPNRDTPAQLKTYLGYYDAGFQGLTGEQASIQKLANGVSIPFIPADTSKENYTVDHSGNLVIVGPDGRQRGFIRAPLNNQKLKAQLPALLVPDA